MEDSDGLDAAITVNGAVRMTAMYEKCMAARRMCVIDTISLMKRAEYMQGINNFTPLSQRSSTFSLVVRSLALTASFFWGICVRCKPLVFQQISGYFCEVAAESYHRWPRHNNRATKKLSICRREAKKITCSEICEADIMISSCLDSIKAVLWEGDAAETAPQYCAMHVNTTLAYNT